jgi:DNA helicase-2/ATP-dependent DNA helicase PcrA
MLLKKLGKYEIKDWLGGGRFGDVFLARDTILDKYFALKISRMRKEEIAMLKDEAKLLASLSHLNIVRFYNIDFIEHKLVLVMEFIRGKTLRDIITNGGIDINESLIIITQIISAVQYAHKNNVLHRDLKPENILIEEGKEKNIVKVTDFGLARFIKSGSISASTAGTPIYMAPEAWSGSFNEKSDVWSIGVMFYELLTGIPPFLADNLDTLRDKIEKNKFLVPTMLRPAIPEYIEDLIMKSLSVNPQSRPVTAELLQKLTGKGESIKVKAGFTLAEKETRMLSLTPAQLDVINAVDGKVLLLGQAGCGKTTTLAYAIARLIEKGMPVMKILVCTFTNKAANDIKERLLRCKKFSPYDLWIGTFHTIGLRILRRDVERLDISADFNICEPKKIFAKMQIETGKYRANAIIKFIERLKAKNITPDKFKPKNNWQKTCHVIYQAYQKYLKEHNLLDYDDLIIYAIKLLEEYSDIKDFYNSKFDYIFVDELQDINPAQYRLINLLSKHNLFLTGDEDQAIYGWRGADRDFIYRIPKDYKDIKSFYLTKSFRLPQAILEIANNLMLRETTAIPKPDSGDIFVYAAKSEKDEANYVVKEIKNLRKQNFHYHDIALLYRMNYISRIYEEAFIKSRIPHTLIGGTSFYERADIKPLMEYLELLDHYATHRKIDNKLTAEFIAKSTNLFKLKKKNIERIKKIFEHHLENRTVLSPAAIINEIISTANLKGENIDEMLALSKDYAHPGITGFLSEIRLIQELDLANWGKDTVKLMTIHGAKGLEFPVVFVVDFAEDIFPLTKKMAAQKELEEERRLAYVALTRAQNKLYILYPKGRYGRYKKQSRFLVDMFKTTS